MQARWWCLLAVIAGGCGGAATNGAVTTPSGGTAVPRDVLTAIARPCRIDRRWTIEPESVSRECFPLWVVRPDGLPLWFCTEEATTELRYDPVGHLVREDRETDEHDAEGRLIRGGDVRYLYDAEGRLLRIEGERFVEYRYQPDGTFSLHHDHPDSDEFCEAERVEVTRDAQGRVIGSRFDYCAINESPRTERYALDDRGRLSQIEVDIDSDGSFEVALSLDYCD